MKNLHLQKSGVCHTQKMLNWIFDTKGKSQLALLGFITLMGGCSVFLWFFFITFENEEMIPPTLPSASFYSLYWYHLST